MAKYKSFNKEVKKALDIAEIKSLRLIGAMVKSEASQNVIENGSVDTGDLHQRMAHEIFNKGTKKGLRVGNPLKHASYVELGTGEFAKNGKGRKGGWWWFGGDTGKWKGWHFTRGQKPKPFLAPAVSNNKQDIKGITEDVFREVMK